MLYRSCSLFKILSYEVLPYMNIVLSPKEAAKRDLGKLLMKLRLGSNMKKMNQLAAKCGIGVNELHKLEGGRGHFPDALVRKILTEVEADTVSLKEMERHLKIIHPLAVKNRAAAVVAVPSLVPAFAG